MVANGNALELVYVEQSILDRLVKGKLSDLRDDLRGTSKYLAIYSPETMKEIARIEDSGDRQEFFDCLESLGAQYLTVDEFGNPHLSVSNPTQVFESYVTRPGQFVAAERSLEQLLYKMSGGRKGEDFTSVLQEGGSAVEGLLSMAKEQLKEVEDELGEIHPFLDDLVHKAAEHLQFSSDSVRRDLENTLDEHIPDQENFDGPREFREYTESGPQQLNYIRPPNVIPQIWERLNASDKFDLTKTDMEDFFGGEMLRISEAVSGKKPTLLQGVNGLYNLLNYIGYQSDSQLDKERKFTSALSDQSHAGYAAYTHILVSGDRRLVLKSVAIYEYLGISTKIRYVKPDAEVVQLADAVDVVSNPTGLGL